MLWCLLFTPLVGSALCGLLHFAVLRARRGAHAGQHGHGHATDGHGPGEGLAALAGHVACAAMAAALVLSIQAWSALASGHDVLALESSAWPWISAGTLDVQLSL